jgi:ATP-dependent RNA helicase SUPV3L1/SUV3
MGKKNKKLTKINQKVKKYFDGDPFDIGIKRVDSETLSRLFATIGIYDIEHDKASLLKTIRTLWSEPDSSLRKEILTFFENEERVYQSDKPKEPIYDRDSKIDSILNQLDVSHDEATLLIDAFMNVRSKKITISKMESKLQHIRFDIKKNELQKILDGVFDIDDTLEFNASFVYHIYEHRFHKILTLNTKPYSYEYIKDTPFDEIVEKISDDKEESIAKKQKQIDNFLSSLKEPHKYLTQKQIVTAFRVSPPKSRVNYPLLSESVLKEIVKKFVDVVWIELHDEELVLQIQESITLPFSDIIMPYILDIHIELNSLLKDIWSSHELDFSKVLKEAKDEHEGYFLSDLTQFIDQCRDYASLLHLSDEVLHAKVYEFLVDLLPKNLLLSPKILRKATRTFIHKIQADLIKKQRQELLAGTIRDFKNLFPLAREMRRKLILHIGPTNSGKTYEAMKKLKDADTGYYLAPLRLLALEGYEELKKDGVDASLITGEEQILNEDATHISSTIEMLNFEVDVDVCVIDEVQMIDDRDRGWAWANAIIGVPAKEIIMTGSSNVREAVVALAEYLGEELEIIEFERKNPLTLLEFPTDMKDVKEGSAIIAFSRRDVLKLKQKFSKNFSVSVVYGNLSPEVRREEARRFRDKQTQILIATDAIAMGMNLPIKTILFSKANKFDGVTQRDLFASEIHQISGRAGRFGLDDEGFVGALSGNVLKVVKKNFYKADRVISLPFKVMANLEHIKLVGNILEENSLSEILKFFVKNMEFNGPFHATNLDDMMEVASIVDNYDLDIATKYHLACAPLTLKSPYILSAYESYILSLEKKQPVSYVAPVLIGSFAQTADELLRAEDMVKEISLYLWLSYRFRDYFLDADKAKQYRGVLNKFIEESLQQKYFVRKCRICGTPLPLNSRYDICQSCFKKYYTHKKRYTRNTRR